MTADTRRRRLRRRRRAGRRDPGRHPRRRRPADRRGGPRAAAADGAAGFRRPRLCHRPDLASACWRRPASGTGCPAAPARSARIRVADGRPGEPASPLSSSTSTRRRSRREPFGWMVEARSLRVALNARLPGLPNLQVFAPAEAAVDAPRRTGATVRLADGQVHRAPGWWSARRAATARSRRQAGIRTATLDYRQIGMVGAFAHERPHAARRWSSSCPTAPSRSCRWPGRAASAPRPIRMPPPSSGPTARDLARRMLALDDAAFGRELARRLGDHLGAHPADRAALVLPAVGAAGRTAGPIRGSRWSAMPRTACTRSPARG